MSTRAPAVVAAVAAATALAGCTAQTPWGQVSDADRQRHEVLRTDPVFADLGVPLAGGPGEVRDWLLVRGEVRADLPGITDLSLFRARGGLTIDDAGTAGWTVYRTECPGLAQRPAGDPRPVDGAPLDWVAWAYRIADGVSYLLRIGSTATQETDRPVTGTLTLTGYAPHSDEPADLIPEHPPAVAEPCVRAATAPASTEIQGLDVVFDRTVNRDGGQVRQGVR